VPKTTTGRVAGIFIMFTGVGVLGVLAGSLASFFRLEPSASGSAAPAPSSSEPEPEPVVSDAAPVVPVAAGAPDVLAREVAALREQITGLTAEIARLGPRVDGSGDG
jgi:voltage-gated potassium channel